MTPKISGSKASLKVSVVLDNTKHETGEQVSVVGLGTVQKKLAV